MQVDTYENRRHSQRVESGGGHSLVSEGSPDLVRCSSEHSRTKDELPEVTLQIHPRYSSKPSRMALATACVLVVAESRLRTFWRCARTVSVPIESLRPISR